MISHPIIRITSVFYWKKIVHRFDENGVTACRGTYTSFVIILFHTQFVYKCDITSSYHDDVTKTYILLRDFHEFNENGAT